MSSYAQVSDYKVVKMKVYLNDKRLFRYRALLPKDQGLISIEEKLAKYKVISFPYFKGIFRKVICYITIRSDSIKYISMETGIKLSKRESSALKEKIVINTNYKKEEVYRYYY